MAKGKHITNSVVLIKPSEMSNTIPEAFKETYWLKNYDNNDVLTYVSQTWQQSVDNKSLKHTHGATNHYTNLVMHGNPNDVEYGDRYFFSMIIDYSSGDIADLKTSGYNDVLTFVKAKKLLIDSGHSLI